MPDPRPGDRQPGEAARSSGYFTVYRDLGPGRTIEAAGSEARKRHASEGRPGRPPTDSALRNLSRPPHPVPDGKGGTRLRGQDWVRRATAWGAEQDRLRRMKRITDFLEEDRQEGISLGAAYHKTLLAVNALTGNEIKGKDAIDAHLDVIRLRRLRRGQVTELTGEVQVEPMVGGEEDDLVAAALAADPELIDRWEDAVSRAALARLAADPRAADQPGTVDPLPLPAGGGEAPPPDGGSV